VIPGKQKVDHTPLRVPHDNGVYVRLELLVVSCEEKEEGRAEELEPTVEKGKLA
jgi:hypothetical protein